MKDLEIIEKLYKLKKENPSLEIKCRINEVCNYENYNSWFISCMVNCEIDYYLDIEEYVGDYIAIGIDEIIEKLHYNCEDNKEYELYSDEEFDNAMNELCDNLIKDNKIKKAIFIEIDV